MRSTPLGLHFTSNHKQRKVVQSYAELTTLLVGPVAGFFVKTGIVALQMGCCVCYFIFVGANVNALFNIDQGAVMIAMLLCEAPLSLIRDIGNLNCTNTIANAIIAICIFTVFACAAYTVARNGVHEGIERGVKIDTAFLFFGMCVFAFEGSISGIIPIAASLAPKDRNRFVPLFVVVVAWIGAVYLVYSILSYLSYGPEVKTIVTLSLGDSIFPAATVRAAYVAAVVFTFPLMLFPASAEIERSMCKVDSGNIQQGCDVQRVGGTILRLILLLICFVCAFWGRSSLDHIVALLGSLFSAPLALVVPPLLHRAVMVQKEVEV
jgi:proton-coupled amino acid transporter